MKAQAHRRRFRRIITAVTVVILLLVVSSCAGEDATPEYLGDGSLGTVEVAAGQQIQIRSVFATAGDLTALGEPEEVATVLAVEDYGPIHGFDVHLGIGYSDLCTREGGMIAGSLVAAEGNVAGVVGTRCSVAATQAAPILSDGGLVLISPSNTAPSLTSDLAGNQGSNHSPGYYRTSHNDLIQGEAVARFLTGQGIDSAAAIHDGGPYTMGLAIAFSNAFADHGGAITGVWEVDREDEDLSGVLAEIGATSPQALFFPLVVPIGSYLVAQVRSAPQLSDTVLVAADALLDNEFLPLPETEGIYIAGPDTRFGGNTNQSTGKAASDVEERVLDLLGRPTAGPYWGHAYDATVLLLDAIAASSFVRSDDDALVIDRAGLRMYLDNLSGFSGVTGVLSCDQFGDCGASRVVVYQHLDPSDPQAIYQSIVFESAP